jgi:hypothetical protein
MKLKQLPDNLLCPECGDDKASYIHITKVIVDQGYQITTHTRTGAMSQPGKPKRQGGSKVKIEFICKMGHRWRLDFASHKEQTLINLEGMIRHMPWLGFPWKNLQTYEPL